MNGNIRPLDLDALVEKRLGDPEFVREYIAAHKEEIASLTRELEEAKSVHSHTHAVAREEWAVRLRHEITVRDRLLHEVFHWIDTAEFDDGSESNCPVSAIAPADLSERILAVTGLSRAVSGPSDESKNPV